jgi:hypothetical protein
MAMTGARGKGMSDAELNEFLSAPLFAKIATTMEDGWPVISPVWYGWDGSSFLVVSKARTSLVKNLRRDQRCGLVVENPQLPYKRVSVQGIAEFLPEDFDWVPPTREMVIRYLGHGGLSYAEATFSFPRVPFRVWPVRMATWNGGGFDRTFHRETVWHDVEVPSHVRA